MEIFKINFVVCYSHYLYITNKNNKTFVKFYIYNGFLINIQMVNNSNHLFNVFVIILSCITDIYVLLFYMIFHNKADFIESNYLLISIKRFILYSVAKRSARVCMLCIWLHLRDY